MTCERCEFIETEYVRAAAEDLTRDALLLALAAARVERNRLRLHCQSYQADLDSARAEGVRLRLLNERMLQCITGFVETVEAAEAHATGPKGGQQVTFSGDFASVPPSVRGRLRWWSLLLTQSTQEEL